MSWNSFWKGVGNGLKNIGSSIGNAITGFVKDPVGSVLSFIPGGEGFLNYRNQQENYQYQKDLQQMIFEREDNAVQRRAADLEKAGLSKTLAAGSAAGAGSVVATSAPQSGVLDNLLVGQQIQKAKADIATAQADAVNKNAQAEYFRSMAEVNQARGIEIQVQTEAQRLKNMLLMNDVNNIPLTNERLNADLDKTKAIVENYIQNTSASKTQQKKMMQEINQVKTVNDLHRLDVRIKETFLSTYSTVLALDVEKKRLDNAEKLWEYNYMDETGVKVPSGGTFANGLGALTHGFWGTVDNIVDTGKFLWNSGIDAYEWIANQF